MHNHQVQYVNQKIIQDLLRGGIPEQRGSGATIRHEFTQLDNPGWEFVVELERNYIFD